MPSIESGYRYQKAVLWTASGVDDYGVPTLDGKREISVRWVERQNENLDPAGKVVGIDADVTVNEDLPIGSILWLGSIDDLPSVPTDLYQIVSTTKTPDVRARNFHRTVAVKRYSNKLPTLA